MEPVSPELVLVDPALAGRVRSRLRQPDDTLARVETLVQASRRASLARRSAEITRPPITRAVDPSRPLARTPRRSAALAGAVAAGTLVVALLIGVRIELGGTSAGADTTVIDRAPVTSAPEAPSGGANTQPAPVRPRPANKPSPQPAPVRPRPASKPSPQRFAWAPTAGASAYHVELFLDSSRVFEADTKGPTLTIPARWKFAGRTRSLQPADYRWYVWPVLSGQRAAEAIVQATLTIPPR